MRKNVWKPGDGGGDSNDIEKIVVKTTDTINVLRALCHQTSTFYLDSKNFQFSTTELLYMTPVHGGLLRSNTYY